ncbi:MAG: sensor histidine kinase [Candidatus Limnocylindria bacterium]
MSPKLAWLDTVIRLAIVPVILGAIVLWLGPQRSGRDVAAGAGLVLLGAVHLLYWSRPWHASQRRAVAAAAALVLTNFVLLHVLGLSEQLLWLYPALIVGAGLRPPAAVVGVGLMAVAAGAPGEIDSAHVVGLLGPGHAIFFAIALAGLGMVAVRQLIAVNADLHATRAELAELAVAAERERLARELHDLLGRTLSLIAVKAELAGRLRAGGDLSADAEILDVQRLAREAIREVREAVAGSTPSLAAELVAAPIALRTAGIEPRVDEAPTEIDPSHEATVAWALREAVTNVVKHSGARTCRISLQAADGVTALEVIDDGPGPVREDAGSGLSGLAQRVHALGGTFEAGPNEASGFRLRVSLGAAPARLAHADAR